MSNRNATHEQLDLGDDLVITKTTRRSVGTGAWVEGTLHGHQFQALVFPEHAALAEYELYDSRISKLWVQRLADKQVVFNFDRGMDLDAQDATVRAIVGFLAEGLAEYTYGR